MQLPRIAILCAIPGLGGAEISLLELVGRLREFYEFHFIVPDAGPLQTQAERLGATVWLLHWPESIASLGETAARPGIPQLLRSAHCMRPFAQRLSSLLYRISPSLFVTNSIKAHILGAMAKRPKDVPMVWYIRDGLEQRSWSRSCLALLSSRCDLALCISRYVESQVRHYVSANIRTEILYNIVDLDRFQPSIPPAPDLHKNPEEIWYGMVGPITPLKGQDLFLTAAEKVAHELPNASFVIAGKNPYLTQAASGYEFSLRCRAASATLQGRVKFLGFRDDVPGVLAALDVLVQPNRGPEGLGRSVLEAMACGVPVVAVDKWGPSELVEHCVSGLLFIPLDTDTLASHLITLGKSPSWRKSMGEHGRCWIRKNLLPGKLINRFVEIVDRLIFAHAHAQERKLA
jgi:glycosyltransferase involved in cell wall biosynthesis